MNYLRTVLVIQCNHKIVTNKNVYLQYNSYSDLVNKSDYVVLWEVGVGFTILAHHLSVRGSKIGETTSAPDVNVHNLADRIKFLLNDNEIGIRVVNGDS